MAEWLADLLLIQEHRHYRFERERQEERTVKPQNQNAEYKPN